MTLTATPGLTIGGVSVDTAPNTSLTDLVVLDGLSITWGRDQVMDQPDPATARCTVFDPASTWATSMDLIGQPISLTYTATKPGVGVLTEPIFLGRITSARLTRKTVTRPDGTEAAGQQIALTASSILNDLANIIPAEDWPDETMDARRARIQTYATNAGVTSSVTIRGYWTAPHAAPIAAANQVSILDHLVGLYNSTGPDRMTFIPWSRQVIQVERRDHPAYRTLGGLGRNLAGDGTPRDGKGAYAQSLTQASSDGGMTGLSAYLDAQAIEFDDASGLSLDITNRITRILLTHPDGGNGNQQVTIVQLVSAIDPTVDETKIGVRSASQSSICNYDNYAATAASDLAYMAAREGSGWRSDPFIFRSSLNGGGFDNWTQLSLMLLGGEVLTLWFIQRSWFAEVGIRPVFGIIGGTVTYTSGEWLLSCQITPVSTASLQHAIAWEEIDDGTTANTLIWTDGDDPNGLHESLTYEDIGFVGQGLGVTVTPANTYGWDTSYP